VEIVDGQMATLSNVLTKLGHVVVAFSGGADSAFLAKVATDTLGASRAFVATAVSPSLAPEELADCEALAREWNLNWRPVATTEFDNPAYVANDGTRCYHCKTSLLDALAPIAHARGATIVLGVNTDDLSEHRPGQSAAIERGAVFPLVESGFTKSDVRAASKRLGLRTWDKPAAACLSSRLPYGTPVTIEALGKVGRAESALRALGFGQLRVRHYGDVARVELEADDLVAAVERRDAVVAAVRAAGYAYVTLDLEGFRSGNLNDALPTTTRGVQ
jgi:pyridinium-3,5-biscarboxylic acid mononucleotide sulfurtransferase